MLELWHEWNSVHSFKVRVVLAEKGLAWAGRRVELLKFEHLQPDYLRINPGGVVPTLVHEGRTIVESSVICQYLDEAFAQPPLLPQDPYARAQARIWLKYFDEIAHPALRAASFQLLYRPLLAALPQDELDERLASHPDPARVKAFRAGPDEEALNRAIETFRRIIGRIDAAAVSNAWLAGGRFSLADAAMAPFAERLAHLELSHLWNGHPSAARWSAAVLGRDSVLAAGAPVQFRFPLRRQSLE